MYTNVMAWCSLSCATVRSTFRLWSAPSFVTSDSSSGSFSSIRSKKICHSWQGVVILAPIQYLLALFGLEQRKLRAAPMCWPYSFPKGSCRELHGAQRVLRHCSQLQGGGLGSAVWRWAGLEVSHEDHQVGNTQ